MNTALSSPHPHVCPPALCPPSVEAENTSREEINPNKNCCVIPIISYCCPGLLGYHSLSTQVHSLFRGRAPHVTSHSGNTKVLIPRVCWRRREIAQNKGVLHFEYKMIPPPQLMFLKFGPQLMALSWEGKALTG